MDLGSLRIYHLISNLIYYYFWSLHFLLTMKHVSYFESMSFFLDLFMILVSLSFLRASLWLGIFPHLKIS